MDNALLQTAVWPLFDTLHEGVLIADQQGDVLYVNPVVTVLMGIELPITLADSPLADSPDWKSLLSPPFSLLLRTENGIFRIDAHVHPNDLVQIQISPDTESVNRDLEILLKANQTISGVLDTKRVLALMGQQLMETVHGDRYDIYQWKRQQDELMLLRSTAADGKETTAADKFLPLSPDSPIYDSIQQQAVIISPTDNSIIFPIITSGEPYGVVVVFVDDAAFAVNDNNIRLLSALSNQANTALETALIFEDIFDRERFYNALGRVHLAINFTLGEQRILSLISGESLQVFNVDGAYIWQVVDDKLIGAAAHGHGADEFIGSSLALSDDNTFIVSIVQTGTPNYINHFNCDDQCGKGFPLPEKIKSVLAIPFEQDERIMSVLALVDTNNADRFGEADLTRAMTFGMQVAISLQNVHLFKQLHDLNADLDARVARRTAELNQESGRFKTLLNITARLSDTLDENLVSTRALEMVSAMANATHGVILLLDPIRGNLMVKAAIGTYRTKGTAVWDEPVSTQNRLPEAVMKTQTAVIIPDATKDSRWQNPLPDDNLTSVMAAPLVSNEEAIGVLMLFHPEPSMFTPQQAELVEAAATQVAIAISNAGLYRFIREQAERMGTLLQAETVEAAKQRAILESIADGVVVADEDGAITLANTTAVAILGIPQHQLLSKKLGNLIGIYGSFRDEWFHAIEGWRDHAENIRIGTFVRKQFEISGKVILVHLSPVLVQGQYVGTVSIFRDITKEVEVDRLKTNFISTVSHELRTPMTSIKGYADLLLMGVAGALNDGITEHLNIIKAHSERMEMLVNDLLDISEIGSGKMVLQAKSIDISDLIISTVDIYLGDRILHENKQLTVKSNITAPLPFIHADSKRITQILTNLIDNAFNYTPEHGTISVSACSTDDHVTIIIKDSGIGIAKDDLENVFDRFFRSDEADVQKISGTGLGLSIVHTLVEMHDGKIELDSVEQEGTTVTLTFPTVDEKAAP